MCMWKDPFFVYSHTGAWISRELISFFVLLFFSNNKGVAIFFFLSKKQPLVQL